MTNRKNAESQSNAANELRREYKRQYDRRNREKIAEYTRNYWTDQLEQLKQGLREVNRLDLIANLDTATGKHLTIAIAEALQAVETVPTGFKGFRP